MNQDKKRELIFSQQVEYGLKGTRTDMTGLKSIKLEMGGA